MSSVRKNYTPLLWEREYLYKRRYYYKLHPTTKNLGKLLAAEKQYAQHCSAVIASETVSTKTLVAT